MWTNTNLNLYCTVVFLLRPWSIVCFLICWLFNEYLKAVNNYCNFCFKILSEWHRCCWNYFLSFWSDYERLNLINITFIHFSTILELLDLEVLNLYDKPFIVKFSLKRISIKTISWKGPNIALLFSPTTAIRKSKTVGKTLKLGSSVLNKTFSSFSLNYFFVPTFSISLSVCKVYSLWFISVELSSKLVKYSFEISV